jgi:hypothetical protein
MSYPATQDRAGSWMFDVFDRVAKLYAAFLFTVSVSHPQILIAEYPQFGPPIRLLRCR